MGKSDSMKFWTNLWVGTEQFSLLFPSLYSCCENKNTFVADMGSWQLHRWQWDWSWVENVPSEEDKWCWLPDSTKGFTVKSCYEWLSSYFAGTGGQLDTIKVEAMEE